MLHRPYFYFMEFGGGEEVPAISRLRLNGKLCDLAEGRCLVQCTKGGATLMR